MCEGARIPKVKKKRCILPLKKNHTRRYNKFRERERERVNVGEIPNFSSGLMADTNKEAFPFYVNNICIASNIHTHTHCHLFLL